MDNRITEYVGRVGEEGIRVDRKSIFGNPFVICKGSSRQVVIAQYAIYLNAHIKELWPTLFTLRGRKLLCHCLPQRCHAEVLALVANNIISAHELADSAWTVLSDKRMEYKASDADGAPLWEPEWLRLHNLSELRSR